MNCFKILTLLGSLLAEKTQWIKEKCSLLWAFLVVVLGGVIMIVEYVVLGQYMAFHVSTVFILAGGW